MKKTKLFKFPLRIITSITISVFALISLQQIIISPVYAATNCNFNALNTAQDYNLFVFDSLNQSGSDTEGKIAVGNNATLSDYGVGYKLSNSNGTRDDLVAGNDLSLNNVKVDNGNAVYGNTLNYVNSEIPNGTARKDNVLNFTSIKSALDNNSNILSSYSANGTVNVAGGTITLSGTNNTLNIFNISGSDLNSTTYMEINVPVSSSVLINVNGTNINLINYGFELNGLSAGKILMNLYNASSVNLNGISVRASVLAVNSSVTFNNGVMYGTLAAKNVNGNGQFNLLPFQGCLQNIAPDPTATVQPTQIPLPTATPVVNGDVLGESTTSTPQPTSTIAPAKVSPTPTVLGASLANTGSSNIWINTIFALGILSVLGFVLIIRKKQIK